MKMRRLQKFIEESDWGTRIQVSYFPVHCTIGLQSKPKREETDVRQGKYIKALSIWC